MDQLIPKNNFIAIVFSLEQKRVKVLQLMTRLWTFPINFSYFLTDR